MAAVSAISVAPLLLAGAAMAADLPPTAGYPVATPEFVAAEPFRVFDEVRAGVLHVNTFEDDPQLGINGELLTSRIPVTSGNRLIDFVFGPRIHVGGTAALESGADYGYAGFTWTVPVTGGLFLEAALGGAINDQGSSGPLGCAFTFREAASVGYAFTDHWSLLVGIEHLSHADLCGDRNPGMTNIGAKVGYRF